MVKHIIQSAGSILKEEYFKNHSSMEKTRYDLVTECDTKIEEFIIAKLRKHFPDHSIYSEECGFLDGCSNRKWILDPIDGTADFIFGVPYCAISLCLEENSKIIEAYVYNPISDEFYYSIESEKKSFFNNSQIMANYNDTISDALIAFGFSANYTNINKYYSKWKRIFENCKKGMPLIGCEFKFGQTGLDKISQPSTTNGPACA